MNRMTAVSTRAEVIVMPPSGLDTPWAKKDTSGWALGLGPWALGLGPWAAIVPRYANRVAIACGRWSGRGRGSGVHRAVPGAGDAVVQGQYPYAYAQQRRRQHARRRRPLVSRARLQLPRPDRSQRA